ncbi:hypothetical protein ACLB1E_22615 [Escherichia coli]
MAVYEYPTFATSGFSLVFFIGGILWFIPWDFVLRKWPPSTAGKKVVYSPGYQILWGRDGDLQRSHLAICKSPLVLFRCSISCSGHSPTSLKWPALNEDPITKTIAALIILWALALTQFGGTKYTARIAKVGFFAGILLPAFILIALAAIYLHSGAPVAIEMDSKTSPDFSKVGTLVILLPSF